MNSPNDLPIEISRQGNRSSDRMVKQPVENPDEAAAILRAYRNKELSTSSARGSIATATLFGWLLSGTVTQKEFDDLVDDGSVQEIELGRDGKEYSPMEETDGSGKIDAIRAKLAAYPERTSVDAITPEHVREWSWDMEEGVCGIGAVLTFEKKEADDDGPASSFTLEMRIQPGREFSETARAEAVFGGHPALGNGVTFLVSIPLPLMKNGRRRLFITVVESGTGSPLRLPPEVTMAFREKHLAKIELLHVPLKSKGLMGLVSKAIGKAMGKQQ